MNLGYLIETKRSNELRREHLPSPRRTAGYQAIIARNELIRRLKRKGVSDEEIARRYGIGLTTVGKIHIADSGRRP